MLKYAEPDTLHVARAFCTRGVSLIAVEEFRGLIKNTEYNNEDN
jgi:hypothetical protein